MFDPYRKWLGILPKDQPPHHYRLLSLELFENDLDVIEGAADRQMGFIRQYQSGEHAALAAKLLNEIAIARLCLLKPASKAEYDAKLKKQLATSDKSSAPVTTVGDGDPFEMDAEVAAMMKAPKLVQKPKRKKSKSPQGLPVTVGVGAVVCVLIIVLVISFGRQSSNPLSVPAEAVVAGSNPTATPTPTSIVSPAPKVETAVPKSLPASQIVKVLESKLIDDPVGPPVDLTESVKSATPSYYSVLPTKVPADYQLKFSVTRVSGATPFWVGFVMEGRQGVAIFDGWTEKLCALYVDGRESTENCTAHPGPVFENNSPSKIVLTIHPGHVHAAVDGKAVIDWYGEADRLNFPSEYFPANREMAFVASTPQAYQIASAELIPIKPEPKLSRIEKLAASIDLMQVVDVSRDAKKGLWTMNPNALASSDEVAQIQFPVQPPDEYSLSATIERPADSASDPQLSFGLAAGSSRCRVVALSGDGLGLDTILGQSWNKNETHIVGHQLQPGETANVALTVSKRGIRYDFNGRTLIDWRGDFQLLGLPHNEYLADARKLFLSSRSRLIFRDLKLGPPLDPPALPSHPAMTVGRPVELLTLVDPKRDVLSGTWQSNGTGKRVLGSEQVSKLIIPCEVPSEYKLSINAGREINGIRTDDALTVMLPIESYIAELSLDAATSTICGFHLDGLSPVISSNATSRKQAAIKLGSTQEIVAYVRKTGLKVTIGGKEIINWSGNPNRLSRDVAFSTPEGRIAICSQKNQFWFPKLEIEPLEPSSFPSVPRLGSDGNLLAVINPQRDARCGEWSFDGKSLISTMIHLPWIRIPVSVPERYVLTATVERKEGDHEFFLGMVVGGKPCAAGIDAEKGTIAGLMCLDGLNFRDANNPTRRVYSKPLLPLGQRVTLRCFVLPDTVIVNCGDKEVLRWHGDARRFSSPDTGYLPPNYSGDDRDRLWIGSFLSAFAIHELELKPLTDAEVKEIANGFSGVFPISPQSDLPLRDVVLNAK